MPIKYLLNKYEISDPVEIDSLGVFKDEYLQDLYYTLDGASPWLRR